MRIYVANPSGRLFGRMIRSAASDSLVHMLTGWVAHARHVISRAACRVLIPAGDMSQCKCIDDEDVQFGYDGIGRLQGFWVVNKARELEEYMKGIVDLVRFLLTRGALCADK